MASIPSQRSFQLGEPVSLRRNVGLGPSPSFPFLTSSSHAPRAPASGPGFLGSVIGGKKTLLGAAGGGDEARAGMARNGRFAESGRQHASLTEMPISPGS